MAKYRSGLTAYADGQVDPEQVLNPAIDRAWDSANAALVKTLAGDLDLTAAEVQGSGVIVFDGSPGAAVDVDFPPTDAAGGWHGERLVYVVNATADRQEVTFRFDNDGDDAADGASVTLAPGLGTWLRVKDPDVARDASLDVTDLPEVGAPDEAADYGVIWDASAKALRRLLLSSWPGSGGGGGGGASIVAGAWDTLDVQEVSGSLTELEFDLPSTGYVTFLLTGWLSHDDSASTQRLFLQLSDDGGATWITTGYDWAANDWRSDGGSHIPRSGANDAQIVLAHWSDHDTHNGFEVFIQAALDAGQPTSFTGSMYRHAAAITSVAGGSIVARQRTAGAHDRLKLFFDGSAQIDAGKVVLIGLKSQPESIAIGEPRGALVSKNATQSVANATDTALTWQVDDKDTDGFFDPASPTRLTVPAGVTQARLRVNTRWASNNNGQRRNWFWKNGVDFAGQGRYGFDSIVGIGETGTVSAVLDVQQGDYFEAVVWQDSGGALNVENDDSTWFEIEVVERTSAEDTKVLASADPANVAAVDFLLDNANYKNFKIIGRLVPATASDPPQLRVSDDGGATFKAGPSDYSWGGRWDSDQGTGAIINSAGDSKIQITAGAGNAADEGVAFEITIYSPGYGSLQTAVRVEATNINSAFTNKLQDYRVSGRYKATVAAIDAVRLFFAGGNIADGHVALVGLKGI